MNQAIVLIACAVIAVALLRRLRLPPVLGYLAIGTLLGPHAVNWIQDGHAVRLLGEIGVAFLLFSIGLEFSRSQLLAMRRVLLGLGGAQVVLGTVSGALLAWASGVPPAAALVVGGALAMSSTAIVIKQLTDQAELQTRHGHLALGILLFQDLAAVPFLVVIPILAAPSTGGLGLALLVAAVKSAAALVIMLALGRYALRPLFFEVASARAAELFTLTVLLVSLCAAWLTAALGLSLALGAFLAGMMLSETEYRHQIEIELRPFKDVLLGLFFVTIGMRLDLQSLPPIWPWVVLLTAGLIVGKGAAIALLAYLWRRHAEVALRSGLVLAHGGEFGFALLALALDRGLLDGADAQPMLAAMIISMLIAPLVIRHNHALAARFLPRTAVQPSATASAIAEAVHGLADHVVIAGYGRVGSQIGALLRADQIAFVAIDKHADASRTAWEEGLKVFYGDATHHEVLTALGLARARALVVSFDDPAAALRLVARARHLNADIPILVRSRDDAELEDLLAAGANEVVPETLESSLMLTMCLLARLGVPDREIDQRLRALRQSRYLLLRDV